MRKIFFYLFVFVAIFTTSMSVFSLSQTYKSDLDVFKNNLHLGNKFSKTAAANVSIEVINDLDLDDEQNLSESCNLRCSENCTSQKNSFLVEIACFKPETMRYFEINLSRIPRFTFLSLRVLRI